MQDTLLHAAADKAGAAAEHTDQEKRNKADEYCLLEGVDFIPLAFDCFGAQAEECTLQLARIANRVADAKGITKDVARSQMFQNISFGIARSNAVAILHRRNLVE